jgi:hypothetical protein
MNESGIWVVYHASVTSAVLVENFLSEDDALHHAAKMTTRHSTQHHVAKLVARVKPVQQPTFEIERV